MNRDEPQRFIHDDPTNEELQEELRQRRRIAEAREEMARRKRWDEEHGPLDEGVVEAIAEELPDSAGELGPGE